MITLEDLNEDKIKEGMTTHEMLNEYDHGRKPFVELTLKGGAVVVVNLAEPSKCKRCKKEIWWATTKNVRSMPITKDKDGAWISHFVDCPGSKDFRNSSPGAGDSLDEAQRQAERDRRFAN